MALEKSEDESVSPLSDSRILSNDVSDNNQQFKMELPPIQQISSRPVPKDSQFSLEDDSKYDEQNGNCLLNGSTNATIPPSSSLQSSLPDSMLPTCTGLRTINTEEAILDSQSSTAPITSHDSEIPKIMDVHATATSSKRPVIKKATNSVKGSSPSEIVNDTGCVSRLNLSSNTEYQNISITNATATNDNEICIDNAAITSINKDVKGHIDTDDAVACRASDLESTFPRALAAKSVNSKTTANMSDYLNKQCISNDDTTFGLAGILSTNDPFNDASVRTKFATKNISYLYDEQNVDVNHPKEDNLEKDANEEIKYDKLTNDSHQRDVKSLPTVINSPNFASPTNQCSTDTNNTDAFSLSKNLNDTAIKNVAISANAANSRNATATTKNTVNPNANDVQQVVSSRDDITSTKVNDRKTGENSPSAILKDVVVSDVTVADNLLAVNDIKTNKENGISEDADDDNVFLTFFEKPSATQVT